MVSVYPVLQPSYPVVMPIWITETDEKSVIDLITDLNTSDDSASYCTHPVSATTLPLLHLSQKSANGSPASVQGTLLGKEDV